MSAALDFLSFPADDVPADLRPRRLALVPSWTDGQRDILPVLAPSSATAASLRLTVRGKVVATLAVLAVGLGLLGVAHASARPRPHSATPGVVAVQPGDTLWSIAERIAPGSDPRTTVADLRSLNQLPTVELSPGQILRVG